NTTLKILNIKGQLVKTLVNEYKAGGDYSVIWDGTDKNKKSVSSGVYYYRLQVSNRVKTKSLILVK
ncbi:MAG: FlgD immunoglobulin-like domain containing protein, partial [Candidatus Cloacimonadales bacterium]|nr:FlgD immunoglobulin-like domain containing protein [Candidatus Cloacimonadales bacterium]